MEDVEGFGGVFLETSMWGKAYREIAQLGNLRSISTRDTIPCTFDVQNKSGH